MNESLRERARPAPKRLTVNGPQPSIGFLVDGLEDSHYQWAVLRGAMDAAYDRGAHLLCFVGGVLDAPSLDGGDRNSVFDLARPKNVDALILLSGSIGKRTGLHRLGEYCKRYQAMPACSVAVELEGMSSVCIDNEVGMQAVLDHLVRVHGTERIAFVRGPQANSEAERRFAVYRSFLEKNGIAYSEQRVVQGDFEQPSGKNAVRVLLDERGLRPQDIGAIATANDCMAFGVLDELAARGIRVPDQVAVVGFDDAEEARFTLPPLTTVRQPLLRARTRCRPHRARPAAPWRSPRARRAAHRAGSPSLVRVHDRALEHDARVRGAGGSSRLRSGAHTPSRDHPRRNVAGRAWGAQRGWGALGRAAPASVRGSDSGGERRRIRACLRRAPAPAFLESRRSLGLQ
ncbi:MAG: substrate-binding domain-containing protein [Myxococcota bacterium]|nr:substrate-binding domain-containing protein [Myxococcota bacterium]